MYTYNCIKEKLYKLGSLKMFKVCKIKSKQFQQNKVEGFLEIN